MYDAARMASIGGRSLAGLLILSGFAILVGKHPAFPTSAVLREWFTLEQLDLATRAHLDPLVFVPFGMLVIVFVRMTLGIHLLGPFRPILVAMGLNGAGLLPGLVFFVLVSLLILVLRGHLREEGIPYYARLAVLLGAVVVLEAVAVSLGNRYEIEFLTRAVYFPLVVLCLAADGFARVLTREGLRPALWRGFTTLAVAVALHAVAMWPDFLDLTLRFPETMLVELGAILVVSQSLALRWLESWNPASPPEPMPAAQGPDVST